MKKFLLSAIAFMISISVVFVTACDLFNTSELMPDSSGGNVVSSSVSENSSSSVNSSEQSASSDNSQSVSSSKEDSSEEQSSSYEQSSEEEHSSASQPGDSSSGGGESEQQPKNDFNIVCSLGTPNAYRITDGEGGEKTITFTAVTEKTEYLIDGEVFGNIVIDVGDANKFELGLNGVRITSAKNCPIVALSADECTISSKNGTENFIVDNRADVGDDDDAYSACVYSKTDLTMSGKGTLTVTSKNNNGIHGKDDVEIKNVTMTVKCLDNALKGNDSVTVTSGNITLISTQGDGIKTSNSGISGKGNQKGSVRIDGGVVNVYSARDGIDSAYDFVVNGDSEVNIFTNKYSEYSAEVISVTEGYYYIRSTVTSYRYSIKYFNSDTDYVWKNATYVTFTTVPGRQGNTVYYFYRIEKAASYDRFNIYAYNSTQEDAQEVNYVARADGKTQNDNYDTISVTISGRTINTGWTNYTTTGRPGMNEGNSDKSDYSAKGVKADNEITINGGTVNIKSYDDAVNAGSDVALENGSMPTGNVTITNGTLGIYSNDDGIHADGTLTVSGGVVTVSNSYEGAEANRIVISDGRVSISAKDDGVNGSAASGTAITVSGGYLYVSAGGDGIDSNSSTNGAGISFEGGTTVVVTTSSNNSCIDSERGYRYSGGYVLGICPQGMTSEVNNVTVSNGARSTSTSMGDLAAGNFVTIANVVTVRIPAAVSRSFAIYLGPRSETIAKATSSSASLDANGVRWSV